MSPGADKDGSVYWPWVVSIGYLTGQEWNHIYTGSVIDQGPML
jgi:hypothetical protein